MSNIEKQGIGWLINVISQSEILDTFIDKNDRTPTWDGNIFVNTITPNKKTLIDKVPVQVKCKQVERLSRKISIPFTITDLNNFKNDGGVVLFVVESKNIHEHRIFYASLLPSDIKSVLDGVRKKDQARRSIPFTPLDISTPLKLESILKNFIINRRRQYSTSDIKLPIEDAQELIITGVTDGTSIEDYILSNEQYLYGKRFGGDVEIFIHKINFDSLESHVAREVKINSKIYYSDYKVVYTQHDKIIKIGGGISLTKNEKKFEYTQAGTLFDQLIDIQFLIELFQKKYFLIGDQSFNVNLTGGKINLDSLFQREKALREVEALLNIFSIDTQKLNLVDLDNVSVFNLDMLINGLVYKKKLDRIPYKTGFNILNISNISLGVFIYQGNDKNYIILDMFGPVKDLNFFDDEGNDIRTQISPYIFLKYDFMLMIENLSLEIILESIKKFPLSMKYGNTIVFFGLELIKAYDESKISNFLDTAAEIYKWLITKGHARSICKANLYQIIRRKRDFSKDDKKELKKILQGANESLISAENQEDKIVTLQLICGLNILLENKSEAEEIYDKLPETDKEIFKGYPIYSLAKKLNLLK